jgi:hypothetical protein
VVALLLLKVVSAIVAAPSSVIVSVRVKVQLVTEVAPRKLNVPTLVKEHPDQLTVALSVIVKLPRAVVPSARKDMEVQSTLLEALRISNKLKVEVTFSVL